MKKLFLIFITTLVSIGAWAETKVTVEVNGMVCAFCAQGITKKFKSEPAVQTVDVNLTDKMVKLVFKEGQDIKDEVITSILKDSGYSVNKISRNPVAR